MRLAIIGDVHQSDVAPTSRTDDYRETIFGKLDFIKDTCNRRQVDVSVFLGDIFHRKNPNLNSHDMVRRLIEVLSQFTSKVLEVPGNHDISMTSKNLFKQPLAVLEEAGVISVLGYPYSKNFCFSTDVFDVYGLGYSDNNDKLNENYFSINDEIIDQQKCNILCIHQMLLPDGEQFFGDFLNFGDLAQFDFDIVCCGHYHPGFNPTVIEKYGKLFINPGAISRGSLDVHNLDKEPSFLILDISAKNKITWETVVIPHEPSNKVFDMQKVNRSLVAKEDIERFTTSLKDVVDEQVDISSVDGLLSVLNTITEGDREVIDFIKPYLIKAQETLQ